MCDDTITPPVVPLDVLQELAEVDVTYEVRQYTEWITTPAPLIAELSLDYSRHDLLRKALFEVALLHLRNLAEFLAQGRPTKQYRSTSVVADHYFDNGWSKPKPLRLLNAASSRRESDVRQRLHTHLAHIASDRVRHRRARTELTRSDIDESLVLVAFEQFVDDLTLAHPERAKWFTRAYLMSRLARTRLVDRGGQGFALTTNSGPIMGHTTTFAYPPTDDAPGD